MHQPDYRGKNGDFLLPWTLLHVIKDYVDMVAHLERHPNIRCVVNFVPSLLDQIEDYDEQLQSGQYRDPLLKMLAAENLGHASQAERRYLLHACFQSNNSTMLSPFPHYTRLKNIHSHLVCRHERESEDGEVVQLCREDTAISYLSGSYFSDLLTWYFLAWSGESERRRTPLLNDLILKGEGFEYADRMALLKWIAQTFSTLMPRYKALAEAGQIELSATPQAHPLAPLLLDFKAARESLPEATLPNSPEYPGGTDRLQAHIQAGIASHSKRFGSPPVGMWPAEGALSVASVREFDQAGAGWLGSGEGVLKASLAASGFTEADSTYASFYPWRLPNTNCLLFFRDDTLSDQVGFEYSKWHGDEAAQDFIGRLEQILQNWPHEAAPIVSVMLDGENAWEHYPYNGWHFFEAMYARIAEHPLIHTTTLADLQAEVNSTHTSSTKREARELPSLVAGSWVYGTLSTWVGDVAKNRAWDLLVDVKHAYDRHVHTLEAPIRQQAEELLQDCESSDWFWWFGDYHPAASVSSFDKLFRNKLASLYLLLDQLPPAELDIPISRGNDQATHNGSMLRAS